MTSEWFKVNLMVDSEESLQKCPKCATIISENDKFCTECGSQIVVNQEDAGIKCPECSAILTGDQKFCTECGSEISDNDEKNHGGPQKISKDSSIDDLVKSVVHGGEQFVKDVDGFINKSRIKKKESNIVNTKKTPPSQESLEDDLEQLKYLEKLSELKDKGIISEDEFQKKKQQILNL